MIERDTLLTDHNTKTWRVIHVRGVEPKDAEYEGLVPALDAVGSKLGQVFVVTVVPGP